MQKDKIKEWITGRGEPKTYHKTIIMMFLLLILMFIISSSLFPGGYSILTNEISDLGSNDNPVGQWLFRPYFVIFPLLMIPHALFLYRCLLPDVKLGSRLSIMFLIIGMIGMMGVGIFPANPETSDLHYISAGTQIVGTLLHIIFSIHPLIKKMVEKRPWPNPWILLILFLLIAIPSTLTVIYVGIPLAKDLDAEITPSWIWPVCEWSIFNLSVIYYMGLILMAKPLEK